MAKKKAEKTESLSAKSADELKGLLTQQCKAQMNMRFARTSGQLEKTHEIRTVRRSIARIKTLLAQKSEKPAATAPAKKSAKTKTKKAA